MPRRLPPLNALRAFEAAARHGSFTLAADELAVTPAAVSHQVKALEEYLGHRLFRRFTRGLALTDQGRAYLPGLTDGLDRLAEATEALAGRRLEGRLTVSVIPSFAARWLVPRLGDFYSRFPQIDVVVEAEFRSVDFARENVDIGIRYGRGRYPGLHVEPLLKEDLYPVCSPGLLNRSAPLKELADLRHYVLLHDSTVASEEVWVAWTPWLKLAGITDIDVQRGPRFSDTAMLLLAAIAGHGVAIGRSALMGDDLRAGSLVRPFDIARQAVYSYWIVTTPSGADDPKIAVFCHWLAEQAARDKA